MHQLLVGGFTNRIGTSKDIGNNNSITSTIRQRFTFLLVTNNELITTNNDSKSITRVVGTYLGEG